MRPLTGLPGLGGGAARPGQRLSMPTIATAAASASACRVEPRLLLRRKLQIHRPQALLELRHR